MIVNSVNNNFNINVKPNNSCFRSNNSTTVHKDDEQKIDTNKDIKKKKNKTILTSVVLGFSLAALALLGIAKTDKILTNRKLNALSKNLSEKAKIELNKVVNSYYGSSKKKLIKELANNNELQKKAPDEIYRYITQIAKNKKLKTGIEDFSLSDFSSYDPLDCIGDLLTGLVIFDWL